MTYTDQYTQKLNDFVSRADIQIMRQFSQHGSNNTLNHVVHVAMMCHKIQQALHLHVDEDSLIHGAVLHDYYLYDFKAQNEISAFKHGTGHPVTALNNASRRFNLNNRERNIIYSHMWPLTPTHLPLCKEAWLVSTADKICALQEAFLYN